ncbi:signal peptide peptidase SppA [Cerasicoccus arenae]|uniref:Signal peptide peptidase SppA n=1 Tax=Cerasicoccus arenae TaxID=424488 RepID=A0A8J3DHF2_9BACT|nr:signal peptide peptidase SppA [Cerasicoccus arenae]MBK1856760.1 signal peptide peptidase SppA [Cerasicoccus arenae]GHB99322.1 signal peptide peptidase SppA [Cerasicoccus arenae]
MKEFFKIVLGNLVAQSIIVSTLILGGLAFLVMVMIGGSSQPVDIEDHTVLVVELWANISDAPKQETLNEAINQAIDGSHIPNYYLLELIDALEQAENDDRIDAIFIHGTLLPVGHGSGLAVISEVREALEKFKKSGKPIYAYMVDPSMKDYYLMSIADRVYMNPFGLISLNGIAAEGIYLGDAFKKYGIGVQATKVGKYKSAVEMFTGNAMSPADREQLTALIEDLWQEIITDIASARGASRSELLQQSNEQGFFIGAKAKEIGLVDQVAYFDQVIEELKEKYEVDEELNSFRQIALSDYIRRHGFRAEGAPIWPSSPQIAVIYAEGEIVDGEGYSDQIGGDRLSRWIRQLRLDDDVAAIVLRVNSPGGSAVASELIQREVREARKEKPVVVSMGSMAASGGYWISVYSDQIFADPATITGSIGVFGLVPNLKELANEHGVTFDGVKTSQYADLFTVSRPKTESEMALIQQFTDHIYDEFINKVAEGRGLPLEEVQTIAQGRVWSGADALKVGLVDQIGGLTDAIKFAVTAAGVQDDWMVTQMPEPRTLAESIVEVMQQAPGAAPVVKAPSDDLVSATVRRLQRDLASLRSFNDPRNVYARLPFSLEIQ